MRLLESAIRSVVLTIPELHIDAAEARIRQVFAAPVVAQTIFAAEIVLVEELVDERVFRVEIENEQSPARQMSCHTLHRHREALRVGDIVEAVEEADAEVEFLSGQVEKCGVLHMIDDRQIALLSLLSSLRDHIGGDVDSGDGEPFLRKQFRDRPRAAGEVEDMSGASVPFFEQLVQVDDPVRVRNGVHQAVVKRGDRDERSLIPTGGMRLIVSRLFLHLFVRFGSFGRRIRRVHRV